MNIRFLITAAVAAVSLSVFAQGKPPAGGVRSGGPGQGQRGPGQRGPGGGMRRGMPDELKKQLALTPAQEKQLQAINEKYRAKMQTLTGGFKMTPGQQRPDPKQMQAMQDKMKANGPKIKVLMDARKKETDAVLTAKQKTIMEKWRAAHPQRMGGAGAMRGGPGAGGPPPPGGKHGG